MKAILNSRECSKRNTVRVVTRTTAQVSQENEKTYTVDLARKTCSCGHYQQNDIPCGHAYSVIIALNRARRDYVPAVFSTTTLRNTYSQNIQPVTLAEVDDLLAQHRLQPNSECLPPLKLRQGQGRPRNRRLIRGSQRKQTARAQALLNLKVPPPERGRGSQQCSHCTQWGHNRKTCTEPFVL